MIIINHLGAVEIELDGSTRVGRSGDEGLCGGGVSRREVSIQILLQGLESRFEGLYLIGGEFD